MTKREAQQRADKAWREYLRACEEHNRRHAYRISRSGREIGRAMREKEESPPIVALRAAYAAAVRDLWSAK